MLEIQELATADELRARLADINERYTALAALFNTYVTGKDRNCLWNLAVREFGPQLPQNEDDLIHAACIKTLDRSEASHDILLDFASKARIAGALLMIENMDRIHNQPGFSPDAPLPANIETEHMAAHQMQQLLMYESNQALQNADQANTALKELKQGAPNKRAEAQQRFKARMDEFAKGIPATEIRPRFLQSVTELIESRLDIAEHHLRMLSSKIAIAGVREIFSKAQEGQAIPQQAIANMSTILHGYLKRAQEELTLLEQRSTLSAPPTAAEANYRLGMN